MKNKTTSARKPQDWQTNPKTIQTAYAQFWVRGVMANSELPMDQARTLIGEGQAFAISDRAIGMLTNGKMDS